MYRYILFIILFSVFFISCKEKDLTKDYIKFEEQFEQNISTGSSAFSSFVITSNFETYTLDYNLKIGEDTTINLNPFSDYLKRDFFTNAIASRYFLQEVPGHLFRKNQDGTFTKVTFNRLVNNDAYPLIEIVDEVYYNNKITDRKILNAAASIIKLNISANEVVELILKDDVASYMPDSLFNTSVIKAISEKIIEEDWEDYYIAKGAVVSSVVSKVFKETKFAKKVEAGWITADGEIYNSKENFKQRKDVGIELVSLKDYLLFLNLNDLNINN